MKTVIRGALAATFLSAACAAGLAADLPAPPPPAPPPVFVDTYQPFQVRLKVGGVVPTNGAGTVYDFGAVYPGLPNGGSIGLATGLSGGFNTVIPGASTSTSFSIIPMLDVAYYINQELGGRSHLLRAHQLTSRAPARSSPSSPTPGCSRQLFCCNITSPISAPFSLISASA